MLSVLRTDHSAFKTQLNTSFNLELVKIIKRMNNKEDKNERSTRCRSVNTHKFLVIRNNMYVVIVIFHGPEQLLTQASCQLVNEVCTCLAVLNPVIVASEHCCIKSRFALNQPGDEEETLRKETRLRVFRNKVLGKNFGPKRGDRRRLRNSELNDLYGKPDIIRTIKSRRLQWAGHMARMGNERRSYSIVNLIEICLNRHVARMGDERGVRKILEGKPEGKRPVGRPRMKWENNIYHDLREVDYTGVEWKTLAQDRDVWRSYVRTAMNLRVR
ncbi:hypothetical protein C0J52_11401 [Blattella germanica]|nr:hypothetical protein C0J52_11401 [Blattella germanica]